MPSEVATEQQTPGWMQKRVRSFRFAAAGIVYALKTQPNTWIHAVVTSAVLMMGLWLQISLPEWAVLALAAGLVWSAELFNTAVEAAVDLITPAQHPLAKAAKDAAAGAVLAAAVVSVIVGLLILGPPLVDRLF